MVESVYSLMELPMTATPSGRVGRTPTGRNESGAEFYRSPEACLGGFAMRPQKKGTSAVARIRPISKKGLVKSRPGIGSVDG
jgi:hypothetical protein